MKWQKLTDSEQTVRLVPPTGHIDMVLDTGTDRSLTAESKCAGNGTHYAPIPTGKTYALRRPLLVIN